MWVCFDLIPLFVVQLVSPGAWLSDLCQERYEVREKKTSKKVLVFFFFFWSFNCHPIFLFRPPCLVDVKIYGKKFPGWDFFSVI